MKVKGFKLKPGVKKPDNVDETAWFRCFPEDFINETEVSKTNPQEAPKTLAELTDKIRFHRRELRKLLGLKKSSSSQVSP